MFNNLIRFPENSLGGHRCHRMDILSAAYWTFWAVFLLVAFEVAGPPTLSVFFRGSLAGFRPRPVYKRLCAKYISS